MRRPHRPLERTDLLGLRRWQRWMLFIFVAMWFFLVAVFVAHLLLALPLWIVQLVILLDLGLVISGVALQFSARCPACGYRLGRQSRLLVPQRCRSCGIALRASTEWPG